MARKSLYPDSDPIFMMAVAGGAVLLIAGSMMGRSVARRKYRELCKAKGGTEEQCEAESKGL